MIQVSVRRAYGQITGFTVKGHSGLGPPGGDIVCAGVSAITQSATLGLAFYDLVEQVDSAKGLLHVDLRISTQESAKSAIIKAMLLGLRQIEEQYPDRVRIEDPNT